MSTNKVNWAARGKEAVKAAEANATQFKAPEGFTQLSGGDGKKAEAFLRYSQPIRRALQDGEIVMSPGDSVRGTFTGTFHSKGEINGKKATYYKIEVLESTIPNLAGKLVALHDSTVLASGLSENVGKEVFIGYQGLGEAKNGRSAPHIFFIAAK